MEMILILKSQDFMRFTTFLLDITYYVNVKKIDLSLFSLVSSKNLERYPNFKYK